jgi:probable rRNA maturation factor
MRPAAAERRGRPAPGPHPTVVLQAPTTARPRPARASVAGWVAAAVAGSRRRAAGTVTVRLVDTREGRAYNEGYRGKAGPTNVLAFPGPPAAAVPAGEQPELGDIIICMPVVAREARAQGKRPRHHLAHLVVHGTLHLLGYDHERAADARVMEAIESRVLARLGLPDPYAAEHVQ